MKHKTRDWQIGEYGLHNTPAGVKQVIDAAIKVCPALANLAIERTWAGLRPVTPDTFPVLGASSRCANLFVAGGYWRNGVLLAPKTAQLVADAVCGCLSPEDQMISREFSMDRFTVQTGASGARRPTAMSSTATDSDADSGLGLSSGAGLSRSEMLELESAASEGMNDAGALSGIEGLFGKQTQSGRTAAAASATDTTDSNVVEHLPQGEKETVHKQQQQQWVSEILLRNRHSRFGDTGEKQG